MSAPTSRASARDWRGSDIGSTASRRRWEQIAASDALSTVDQHPADVGTETFEQTKEDSIRRQIDEQLAELRRAQARVDEGAYGLCEACGRPIGAERLLARPNARFCVDDQRAAERERERAERTS